MNFGVGHGSSSSQMGIEKQKGLNEGPNYGPYFVGSTLSGKPLADVPEIWAQEK